MWFTVRNGLLTLAALVTQAAAAELGPDQATKKHQELEQAWYRFANHGGNDQAARDLLLAGGEPALEILLDLLFDPREGDVNHDDIAQWIANLGDNSFEVREAAMASLLTSGIRSIAALRQAASSSDPEARYRIRRLIKEFERRTNAAGRETLLRPATLILESDWPLDQLQAVTVKHLDRLMQVKEVAYSSEARPLAPLLASLRYSANAEERDLLVKVAKTGRDGAAFVALSVMRGGLAGRESRSVAEHRHHPPPHDYDRVALDCLDPARPRVFRQAMHAASPRPRLTARLYEVLPGIEDEKLERDIFAFLWHQFGDPKARDFFIAELSSQREADFRAAVYQLTSNRLADNAEAIVPKLAASIQKNSWERGRFILARMELFQDKQVAAIAAAGVVSLVSSDAPQTRAAAANTLLNLHKRAGVLDDLVKQGDDASVRAEVKQLLEQWNAQQASSGTPMKSGEE